jgi:hypothetical protein
MKSTGIILYGKDNAKILEKAYELAIEHMSIGASIDKAAIKKSVFLDAYPNFFHISKCDDQNLISIETIRKLIEFLSQKCGVPGKIAVIIENFEYMSRNAANSILKILEEPPEDAVIILTTTKFFAILPTIRSRCLKMHVKSDEAAISEFSDPDLYIRTVLPNIDSAVTKRVVEFIKSGCDDIIDFAKQNAENMDEFFEIAICYCAFLCSKKCDIDLANTTLDLQRLSNLAQVTSIDKQSAILTACQFLSMNK